MNEGWILVFSSPELYDVKIAEDVLKQHGIVSYIERQPDSMSPSGEAQLYTTPEYAENARQVLRVNAILKEDD